MGRPRRERERTHQISVALNAEWLTAFTAWATLSGQRVPDLVAHALRWQYGAQVEAVMRAKDDDGDAAAR